LLLAARKGCGIRVEPILEAHLFQNVRALCRGVFGRHVRPQAEDEFHIAARGQERQQVMILEDESDSATQPEKLLVGRVPYFLAEYTDRTIRETTQTASQCQQGGPARA